METGKMNALYEVLSPWAEIDPIPLKGIAPRVEDFKGKTVGLFSNTKVTSKPIVALIEKALKERYGDLHFSHFASNFNQEITDTEDKDKFEQWVKGVDTVVSAVGD